MAERSGILLGLAGRGRVENTMASAVTIQDKTVAFVAWPWGHPAEGSDSLVPGVPAPISSFRTGNQGTCRYLAQDQPMAFLIGAPLVTTALPAQLLLAAAPDTATIRLLGLVYN